MVTVFQDVVLLFPAVPQQPEDNDGFSFMCSPSMRSSTLQSQGAEKMARLTDSTLESGSNDPVLETGTDDTMNSKQLPVLEMVTSEEVDKRMQDACCTPHRTGPGKPCMQAPAWVDPAILAERRRWWRLRCKGMLFAYLAVSLGMAAALAALFLDLADDGNGEGVRHVRTMCLQLLLVATLSIASAVVEHLPFLLADRRPLDAPGCTPEPPAMWTPFLPRPPPHALFACIETVVVLGKFLVFLIFALHVDQVWPRNARAVALAWTSHMCIVLDIVLCVIIGILLGLPGSVVPNVFSDDRPRHSRNPLSWQLVVLGGAIGALGVGVRGLRFGDRALDECAFAGLSIPARLTGALVLDLPHLIIARRRLRWHRQVGGSMLVGGHGCDGRSLGSHPRGEDDLGRLLVVHVRLGLPASLFVPAQEGSRIFQMGVDEQGHSAGEA